MAKPEWGQKRTCQSCGCRFYDLGRSPISCPKCGANVEPELPFKVRRGSSAAAAVVESKATAAVPVDEDAVDLDADDAAALEDDEEALEGEEEGSDDDESGLIEDASDLGEDDDDMAEVMEHMDEEIEDEV
ncbi:MAG: TIGR02300 family protein [Actinomycetota bacterium]